MKNVRTQIVIEQQTKAMEGDISFFLPKENNLSRGYHLPIAILIKKLGNTTKAENEDCEIRRVYLGTKDEEILDPIINRMSDFLPSFCDCLSEKYKNKYLQLIYFANMGERSLFISSVLASIDFTRIDSYFISEILKVKGYYSRNRARLSFIWPAENAFCVLRESSPGDFVIVGILIQKDKIGGELESLMKHDILDKKSFDILIGKEIVKAFWFCATDYDKITFWHKEIVAENLLPIFESIVDQVEC